MRRTFKWLLVAVAAIVVLTIAAIVALPRVVDTPRVQSLVASSASAALARPVKFQSLSVAVLPYPAIRLSALEIAEDPSFGGGPFVRLDNAHLRLKLWPLLRGRVEFATLVLKQPTIRLVQGLEGRWNFASLGTPREPAAAPRPSRGGAGGVAPASMVSRIVIDDGHVIYQTWGPAGARPGQRLEKVDITLSTRAGALTFSGSMHVVPGNLVVKFTDGSLGLSGSRTLSDASVRARVTLEAKDVGPVVAGVLGPEPAISGAFTGHLDVTGTVGRPRAAGDVELRSPEVARTNPGCPEPKRRRLALSTVKASVTWEEGRLLVQPLTTGIGNGSITTKLAATTVPDPRTELSALVLKGIPLEGVLVDFLCEAYAVTGPLDLNGTFAASPIDLTHTLSGHGQFRIGRGKLVGAGAQGLFGTLVRTTSAVSSVVGRDATPTAPLEFESITATYQVQDGVWTTPDLVYTSRALKARVAGDYALPTGRVNLDVVLDLGRSQVQAKVTGTAASPSIRLSPTTVLRQVDAQKIERNLKELLKKFR